MVAWHHQLNGREFQQTLGNSKDLTEAEEIKKRCQKYTEELYKKCLNDPDNNDGILSLT